MGTVREGLSVLFLFLALAGIITSSCASDRSTTRINEVTEVRGELTGKATIGRSHSPPPVDPRNPEPPQPARGVEILIFTLSGQKVDSVVTGNDGTYSILLTPGIYHVEMTPLPPIPFNIQYTHDLPANVIITEWQETRLNIHILVSPGAP